MNLVGRDAWYTVGVLKYGRIVEHHFNPDYCVMIFGGERQACALSGLAFTREEAIRHCEENRDYWDARVRELEQEEP